MFVSTRSIKDTTIALEEALAGKFKVIVGEEAKKAKEEFRKREERARMEEQLSAKEEEIRKELSAYLSETQSEEGCRGGLSVTAEVGDDAVEEDPGRRRRARRIARVGETTRDDVRKTDSARGDRQYRGL